MYSVVNGWLVACRSWLYFFACFYKGRAAVFVVLVVSSSDTIHSSLDFVLGHTKCRIGATPNPHRTVSVIETRTPILVLVSVGFALSAAKRRKLALLGRMGIFHPSIPIVLVAT